jgi:hypothetical protein
MKREFSLGLDRSTKKKKNKKNKNKKMLSNNQKINVGYESYLKLIHQIYTSNQKTKNIIYPQALR